MCYLVITIVVCNPWLCNIVHNHQYIHSLCGHDILATRMTTSVSIESFDASKVEWDSWSRRFDQWLKISPYAIGDDSADKMRAAFCTFIGSDAFKLLCSLCAPKKPEECTYDALKTKLDAQYGIKRLVLVERYHFYNYKQTEG